MSQGETARSKIEYVSPMDKMMLSAKDLVQRAIKASSDLDNTSLLEIITDHGINSSNYSNTSVVVKAIQLSGTLGFTYNGCMTAWVFCQVTGVVFSFNATVCTRDDVLESLATAIILNRYKHLYRAEENLANIQATLNEIDLQRLIAFKKARELISKGTQHDHDSNERFMETQSGSQEPMMEESVSLFELKYESPWTLFDSEIYGARHLDEDEEVRSSVADYKGSHFAYTNLCLKFEHVLIKYRTVMKSIESLFNERQKVYSMFSNTTSSISESLNKIRQLVKRTDKKVGDGTDRGLLYLWYHEAKTGFWKWVTKTESVIFANDQRQAFAVLVELDRIFTRLEEESQTSDIYPSEKKVQVGKMIGRNNLSHQIAERIKLLSVEISKLLKQALFHPDTMFSAIQIIGKEIDLIQDYVDKCIYSEI